MKVGDFSKGKGVAKEKKKGKEEEMTIMDAVDNLSGMAELDVVVEKEGEALGVKGKLHQLQSLKAEEKEGFSIIFADVEKLILFIPFHHL